MGLADRTPPTVEEYVAYKERLSNWGRWGDDDQLGTLNHITPEARRYAATLVREGRSISMGNSLDTRPGPLNPFPVAHYMRSHGNIGWDYIGINYHGLTNTHIDALCHVFTAEDGQMYNGRPVSDFTIRGARSNSIDRFRDGIVTRGVLYDIPRFRGVDHVALDEPVHGWDLEDCAKAQGIEPRPGDAVIIRSGAAPFYRATAGQPQELRGSATVPGTPERPGVHASALEYLHEHDAAILMWDLQDAGRHDYPVPGGGALHYITIPYMGMPLVDNVTLEDLAVACQELERWEFMVTVAPLIIWGGTGSPVNPIALL